MRSRVRALLLLWLCGVAACGGSTPSSPAPPPSTVRWTLSGTVTEAVEHVAVAGARVAVADGANSGRSTAADAQGRYRLDSLDPGTFAVRITADGFDSETRSVTLDTNLTLDVGLRRTAGPPAGPPSNISGRAVDGVTDQALSGVLVRIEGVGQATTADDGSFQLNGDSLEQVRAVAITSAVTVDRQTHVRVPGAAVTFSLIPRSLDLQAFDQMFRGGGALARWTSTPSLVLQTRVLQFTNVTDSEYTATNEVMSGAEVDALAADLAWALPQLTGNNFAGFAGEQRETATPGERVRVTRPGQIVVARYIGLQAATTFWGYGRWQISGGEVRAGVVMLDNGFENSGSQFRRSLRAHELGHSLGYNHVTARESVMNSSARFEPNAFDKDGAKLAFLRPPLNRSPDVDPDTFTSNLRSITEAVWHGAK